MTENLSTFLKPHINNTPATLRYAFEKAGQPILKESGDIGFINITDILTKIIQDVGRFAEHYASDALYNIDHIRALCETKYCLEEVEIDEIFAFAIRESGVDGNTFLMQRLYSSKRFPNDYVYATPQYRRILAVRVHAGMMPYFDDAPDGEKSLRIKCELKDLTHKFNRIDRADLTEDGELIQGPYPGETGNPIPFAPDYGQNRKEPDAQ